MADFKLVGAVAIKVRPDASGFRKSTDKQVKKELAGYKADVKVDAKVNLDTTKARADADKFEKEESGKTVNWKVKLDHDSVREAMKRFDSLFEPTKKIKFDVNDQGSIDKAKAKLDKMLSKAKVKITYSQDEQGYNQVLAKIAQIRRQKIEKTIKFKTDDATLDKLERETRAKIAALHGIDIPAQSTVKLEYDENRAGLEAVLADIDRELSKFKDQTFYVSPDKPALMEAREAVKEALSQLPVKFEYDENRAALEAAIKEIDAELDKLRAKLFVEATLDEASLLAAREKLAAELKDIHETVKLSYSSDRASLEKVLAEIDQALNDINNKVEIEVGLNEFELAWVRADLEAALSKIPATITYNKNKAGIEKAIAEIDAELAKVNAVKLDVLLTPTELIFAKARLEAELGEQTVRLDYDPNLAGLRSVKAKIEEMLGIGKFHIDTKLDEASLRENLLLVDAAIKEHEQNELKIKTKLSAADYLKTFAEIKALTKNQTVTIFTKVSNSSLLLAAAKLTGLRAASRWTEAFAKSLGTLDRNLPIVAAAVVGLSTLASGVLTLTADMFSLGNGIGEVVRMGGLLAPAMILGLGSTMLVLKAVFKDFGAAIHGIDAAMKRLPPSGQEAARTFRVVFAAAREAISKEFWDKASDGMLRFSKIALPALSAGMVKISGSLGGVFSNLLDSFNRFTKNSGVKVFFDNMSHGLDLAQTGLADFMDAFLSLSVLGSTAFPRMGRAFNDFAAKFDDWVNRLAADGTLSRWIDIGIQGMHDLFNIAGGLVKLWANVGQAAQAAGAVTLHSFSQSLDRLDVITSGSRFQQNMKTIFQGAREATQTFHKALGSLGPAMDVFSVTVKNTLVGASRALGAFIAVIGDVISSPRVNTGLTAFLSGVEQMFISLRPAAASVATILQTFGQILGQVATDSGPLFRNLFQQIATVLTTAWTALEPWLPGLIQIGTTVVNILGPALLTAARFVIPAFAQSVEQLGNGLLPVIQFLANFAAGAAILVSALPLPLVLGIAGGVLALGTAFRIAATVAPLAGAAMQLFGVQASIAAARVQLMIPGIGILLAAATAIGAAAIGAFAASQQNATPFANEYADALMEDAKAAGAVGDAVGEATTKVALKKLVDSGAYDAAKKLGIGTQEVTDAVLKGGSAWDDIQAKIQAAKGAYHDQANALIASGGATDAVGQMTTELEDNNAAAEALDKTMQENRGSFQKGIADNRQMAEAAKAAGIDIKKQADAQGNLVLQSGKLSQALGAAAAASTVLNDSFSSNTAKIDAMRRTFEILVPPNAKQKVAESLGAYVTGLNSIRDSAVSLAPQMQKLGDTVYGEKGFLNVAGGNKAVLQLNQALIDEVNNVWAGAKAAYDAAIAQGKTAQQAFQESQDFIKKHKGDYDQLATDSGVAADKVQGQWDAVFGHEWVLRVSLSGATEAAAKAQAMVTALHGTFDGKKFLAYLDANPDAALKAITDADGAARDYVNHEWKAKLDALPKPAQDRIQALLKMTDEEWNKGDFEATLKAAQNIPGLSEALVKIYNGVKGPFQAQILAALDYGSLGYVQARLDMLANQKRYVHFGVTIDDIQRDQVLAGRGRNGAIVNGSGRGMSGFGLEPIKYFANGGIERHVAQITKPGGPIRVWSEKETQGEAYVPYAMSKRPRSVAILSQVAKDFGYTLNKTERFANGGLAGTSSVPTTTTSTSVTVGTINTVDPEAAIQKLRTMQRDALAVAGII